jgi:LysM domain
MGITSTAEQKLDARIRPDITVMRSVTSYPRRNRPALAVLPGGLESDRATASSDPGVVASRAGAAASCAPVRLTRRGRIVVAVVAVMLVASVAALVWLAVAGRAQAADRVGSGRAANHEMLRVVVRPGDTMWDIAVRADPAADPRAVIQQIIDDNGLTGTAILAGQVLWVPRV